MKISIILLHFMLLSMVGIARNNDLVLYGIVQISKDVPAVNASVELFNADSILQKAILTSEAGAFEFTELKAGKFYINISYSGYNFYSSGLISLEQGAALKLDTVLLTPVTMALENVVVTARRPMVEVKAGKTIFNVENTINAQGSNALELLAKSPESVWIIMKIYP